MKTIWQRYIYAELLKTTILFLVCFFLLFVAIDYSVHMQSFLRSARLSFFDIAIYYGFRFVKNCDLLIPLALLVATIKLLRGMNRRNELLALQAAGLPLKRLMRPFLMVALFATMINLAIAEYLLPVSLQFNEQFQTNHLKSTSEEERLERVRVLDLKDGSRLTFHSFDSKTSTFHDLFWIRSIDDIWRIKTLTIDREHPKEPPLASYVDHIKRAEDGGLHKIASYPAIRLESLKAGAYQLRKPKISSEGLSISQLFKEAREKNKGEESRHAQIASALAMKCARPFLCLLAIITIAPFCLRFSRLSPALPFYAGGIFGLVACFIAIQAGGILVENQALSPLASIAFPLACLLAWSGFRFAKL